MGGQGDIGNPGSGMGVVFGGLWLKPLGLGGGVILTHGGLIYISNSGSTRSSSFVPHSLVAQSPAFLSRQDFSAIV